MTRYYTFNDDGSVAKVYEFEEYIEALNREVAERKDSQDVVGRIGDDNVGPYRVSTVPLLIDHNFTDEGPPVLWETMIFGGGVTDEEYQERYTSVEDARDGHERAIELARQWASKAVRENEEG